jgi:hypothetical protein
VCTWRIASVAGVAKAKFGAESLCVHTLLVSSVGIRKLLNVAFKAGYSIRGTLAIFI